MKVGILGASNKSERYSNMALHALVKHGHQPFPVNPGQDEISGHCCYNSLDEIKEALHTITMYLSPKHSLDLLDQIVAAKPQRVIFNPGTESPELVKMLEAAGINCINACTLVMLQLEQF